MKTIKKNIGSGLSAQFYLGDPRKHLSVSGTFTLIRGALRASGMFQVDASGAYSWSTAGSVDCGITMVGNATRNKILLKIIADSSDTNHTVFKCNIQQETI